MSIGFSGNNDGSEKNENAVVKEEPHWRVKSWFSDFDEKTLQGLFVYFTELKKFNKVVNLVSSKSLVNADITHFADSILASQIVRKKVNNNKYLYDFGSGNGFPGLVYSILYPDQQVILVDSDQRKCEFLKHVATTLALTNVQVQNKQIEHLEKGLVEQVICRGFAAIPKMLLMFRKSMPNGAKIFHMKGEEWGIEISQIPTQLCSSWQPELAGDYVLPVSGIKMFVVETVKIGE